MQRSVLMVFALLGAIACGDDDEGAATPPITPLTPAADPIPPVSPTAPPTPPTSPIASGSPLTVNEWGLIDVRLGETTGRAHAVPTSTPVPVPVRPNPTPPPSRPPYEGASRAPLLYFHLAAGTPPLDITVRVTMPAGTIDAHWPPATEISADRKVVTWRAQVRSEPCSGSSYPTEGEAASLGAFESPDASCVTIGGADFNHLFYAGPTAVPMPLAITREGEGVRILNNGPEIPGEVFIVRRSADRAQTLVASQLAHPGIALSMRAQWPTTMMPIPPASSMVRFGITNPETAAFQRAWDGAFFGSTPPMPETTPQPTDFVLFWLAPSLADQVSTIDIEPPPAALNRALLVRADLAD
jgi:hypothetical protein